jgi:hypothetical protein
MANTIPPQPKRPRLLAETLGAADAAGSKASAPAPHDDEQEADGTWDAEPPPTGRAPATAGWHGSGLATTAAASAAAAARREGEEAAAGEAEEAAADAAADCDAPSDVEAALLLLKAELHAAPPRAPPRGHHQLQHARQLPLPPFVTKSQIYTVLADRTAVDRDLDDLMRRGRARAFKLATGADEFAVLLMADYLAMIDGMAVQREWQAAQLRQQEAAAVRSGDGGGGGGAPAPAPSPEVPAAAAVALRRFRDRVVPRCYDSHVTAQRLLQLMAAAPTPTPGGGARAPKPPKRGAAAGGGGGPAANDADISHLLAAELVSRDAAVAGRLTLTVPGAGRIVRSLLDGRQELAQILGKKR